MRSSQQQQGIYVFSVNPMNGSPPSPPSLPEPNRPTIRLDIENDMKIYFAAPHKLSHDTIYDLIRSPITTRRAIRLKKKGQNKPPRPQNAWILYRNDTNKRMKESGEFI